MAIITSTITSKWQITIPEDVRKELPFKIGERIAWEVDGDKLVGRRVLSIRELAGCLKGGSPPASTADGGSNDFAAASVARDQRLSPPRS